MRPVQTFLTTVVFACSAFAVKAHEFWIDPEDFSVSEGATIAAHIRVGQDYSGSSFSYLPQNIRLFEIAQGPSRVPVEGRIGDRPAMNQPAPGAGLAILLHATTDYTLRYEEFEKFEAFVRHKDAAWTLDVHREKGFPESGFTELYSRYAKSLVAVGDGAGEDRAFGLLTEIVALANPYTDDLSDGMPVQVLYEGEPRSGAQVEIFEKEPDGSLTVTTVNAGEDGLAIVPVRPGNRYMLDAVVLREPDPENGEARGAIWESLWANLTFEVPGS